MGRFLLNAIGMGGLAAAGVVSGRTPARHRNGRSLVTSSSRSMSPRPWRSSDGASIPRARVTPGPGEHRGLTLRDEGQLTFLQLLPFLRSDLYLGVAHFADRVRNSLPSRETGPLLPWGQTFLSESACRNLVKPTELQPLSRPDVAGGLSWALDRIGAAPAIRPGPGQADPPEQWRPA